MCVDSCHLATPGRMLLQSTSSTAKMNKVSAATEHGSVAKLNERKQTITTATEHGSDEAEQKLMLRHARRARHPRSFSTLLQSMCSFSDRG